MEDMDDEDLFDLVADLEEDESVEYYDDDEMDEVVEMHIQNIDITADVEALMEGEDLSEEFKEKAAVIFEAAVKSKTREEVSRIMEEAQYAIAEEVDQYKTTLAEKVDQYLDYVVEEWMQENELAIERGLKGEIAEDFISGLKQLFEDHYIDVPDERYDILEAQSDRISELEGQLNSVMENNIQMNSVNSELVREQVILEVSSVLADTEFEKFKSLTEDVDFGDEDSFRHKLDTLKESYFPKTNYLAEETYEIDYENHGSAAQDIDTSDAMRAYSSAMGRVETRINGR
jgi:SHS2 domain-containing protein